VPFEDIRGSKKIRNLADWPSIAARFEGARMWFAFSRPILSADGRDALLYYDRPCHPGCGEGEWVWFHRDNREQAWRIMLEGWSWIV
jgi:hypothetical protein